MQLLKYKAIAFILLMSSWVCAEESKTLIYKQDINGKEYIYHLYGGHIISVNQRCCGFQTQVVEHQVAGEMKLKINSLWDIQATFDGRKENKAVDAMVGKTYLFKYQDGEVYSVEEVVKPTDDTHLK